jgi:hypothetical protein
MVYNPVPVAETLEGLKNADEIVKVPGVTRSSR